MKKKECKRIYLLQNELIHDWDELNIAFKALIIVGVILFIVVILTAVYSNGAGGLRNSLEVVFRTTLASVFGFLLSSNIKSNSKKKSAEIEKIKMQLKKVEFELETVENELTNAGKKSKEECELEQNYMYKEINAVQIVIALGICLVCILVLSILVVDNKLQNVPAVSQIRDLMCSSIGFLIGESKKK